MMKAFKACKYVIENFDEETLQGIFKKWREEASNLPVASDDDALDPDVAAILQANGCSIRKFEGFQRVIFPEGTIRHQYLVTSVPYSLLTLPSGLQVKEIGKPNRRYSLLYIFDEATNAGYPNTTY